MKQLGWCAAVIIWCLLATGLSLAQTLEGDDLIRALQDGGYVIVMRHASSPRQLPDAATANPDNVNRERQLDEAGREDSRAMGEAFRRLGIEITEVGSSPTYRAMETARLAGFSEIDPRTELGSEDLRESADAFARWLQEKVESTPTEGNILLITHGPNMSGAFSEHSAGMGEGEALVFDPNGNGEAVMVARIRIDEWPDL